MDENLIQDNQMENQENKSSEPDNPQGETSPNEVKESNGVKVTVESDGENDERTKTQQDDIVDENIILDEEESTAHGNLDEMEVQLQKVEKIKMEILKRKQAEEKKLKLIAEKKQILEDRKREEKRLAELEKEIDEIILEAPPPAEPIASNSGDNKEKNLGAIPEIQTGNRGKI